MAVVFGVLGALCVVWCDGWCVVDPSALQVHCLPSYPAAASLLVTPPALHLQPSQAGRVLMLLLYGLTFFFSNFGPNSTTFMLPAETFPPHIRSTLNGFSAACGKAGATIGSAAFKPVNVESGLPATMLLCAGVSLLGLLVTFVFVEDKRGALMEGEAASSVDGDRSEEVQPERPT